MGWIVLLIVVLCVIAAVLKIFEYEIRNCWR
jgi:hypothetical protein